MFQISSIANKAKRGCSNIYNTNDCNYYLAPSLVSSILSFILYSNTFSAEFVYDDSRAIVNNHDLSPETPWYNIFVDDFWGTPLTHSGSHKSYRPLTVATFRLNYKIGGLNPFGYHFVNVLLHSLVTALVSLLAGKLCRKNSTAWIAGLLFAVHPIHSEAVAGVVGRADVLATLFSLFSFFNYLTLKEEENRNSTTHHKRLLATIVLAFLAMLAKEQGIAVLGLCLVYDTLLMLANTKKGISFKHFCADWRRQMTSLQLWVQWLWLIVGICAFLSFRLWIMGTSPDFSPSDNPAAHSKSFLTRLLTFSYLPVFNLKLLLCPSVLSFDWSMDAIKLVESFTDIRNVLSLLLYSLVGYCCVKLLNFQENNESSYSPLTPMKPKLSALPNANFDINGNPCQMFDFDSKNICSNTRCVQATLNGVGEKQLLYKLKYNGPPLTVNPNYCKYVNIPCFCIFWTIVTFLPASNLFFYVGFVVAERVLYLPSVGYCILLAYGAERLLYYFRSSRLQSIIKLGLVLVLIIFSARTYLRNEDWSNEEQLYKSGIDINPSKAYSNLGNVLSKSRRYKEAEYAYKAAIVNRPNMADTHYNLGILLQETGRWEEALQAYENAIHCRERLAVAHLNLGIVLVQLNRKKEAEERYERCSQLNGDGLKDPKTHENAKLSCLYNLGRLEADQGKYHQAIKTYHKAIERLNSHYPPHSLYNMLGESYAKLNDFQNAEKWFKASLRSKPDHVPAHLTYGHLLLKLNQKQLALDHFQKAVQLNPTDYVVYQHLGQYYFETEQYEKAEQTYLTALELDINNFDTIFSLANVYRHLNNNEEAERYYRKSVELRPNSGNAHMNLGAILHLNKKYDEAEQSYWKALEINPDDQVTHENLRKLKKSKKRK